MALWKKAQVLAESKLLNLHANNPEQKLFQNYLADAFNNIGYVFKMKGNIPLALEYYNKSMKLEEGMGDKMGVATLLINIGGIYRIKGDPSKTLECLIKSLKIYQEIGEKKGMASALNAIGYVYSNQSDIPKALEYYDKSLKVREELGDKRGMGVTFSNIGFIHYEQGDVSKALDFLNKSVNILEEIGDKSGQANSLTKIGVIYRTNGDPKVKSSKEDALTAGIRKALEFFTKSLRLQEEIGDKAGIATSLGHIGVIYYKYGDPNVTSSKKDAIKAGMPKALEYAEKSLKKYEEIEEKFGISNQLNNLGNIYLKQNNIAMALVYAQRSMILSKELGYPENIRNSAYLLHNIFKKTGNHKLALENYEFYIKMSDSLNNESTRKASIKSQLKYEYEKQAAADSVAHAKESEIKNAEIAKQTAEIKAKKNQQYALFGGLGLVMVFAGFMYNRFKVTQKQKGIIELQKSAVEEQKLLVEEKQKEILDSIRYAQRIQKAQLPGEKRIEQNLIRLSRN